MSSCTQVSQGCNYRMEMPETGISCNYLRTKRHKLTEIFCALLPTAWKGQIFVASTVSQCVSSSSVWGHNFGRFKKPTSHLCARVAILQSMPPILPVPHMSQSNDSLQVVIITKRWQTWHTQSVQNRVSEVWECTAHTWKSNPSSRLLDFLKCSIAFTRMQLLLLQ